MKNKDIISLSEQELIEKVREEKAGLNKLKLNHAISPIEDPLKIREQRKTVARLLTEATKRKNANNK